MRQLCRPSRCMQRTLDSFKILEILRRISQISWETPVFMESGIVKATCDPWAYANWQECTAPPHSSFLLIMQSGKSLFKSQGYHWREPLFRTISLDSHGSWGCALDRGACWRTALRKLGRWWRFQWEAGRHLVRSRCIAASGFYRGLIGSVR